jgi:hypothetical protein
MKQWMWELLEIFGFAERSTVFGPVPPAIGYCQVIIWQQKGTIGPFSSKILYL